MATLANVSTLVPNLSIMGLFTFIYIAKRLRDDILLPQPAGEPEHNAPEILPPSVTQLLANSCGIRIGDVDVLWMELWHVIWDKQDFPRHDLTETILKVVARSHIEWDCTCLKTKQTPSPHFLTETRFFGQSLDAFSDPHLHVGVLLAAQ